MTDTATDYRLSREDAADFAGLVGFRHEIRMEVLAAYAKRNGPDAVLNLLSQVIGLANSVVANNREMIELLLITECGWSPDMAEKVNLPTMFGAANGVLITGGVDQQKTCGGCAFRVGTPANQCASTTCDADWCSHPGESDFMCHEDLDEKGNPTRKCIGFVQARRNRAKGLTGSKENK